MLPLLTLLFHIFQVSKSQILQYFYCYILEYLVPNSWEFNMRNVWIDRKQHRNLNFNRNASPFYINALQSSDRCILLSLCITMKLLFFVVKKIEFFLFSTKKWKKIETAAGNPYFLPTLLLEKIEMMMRRQCEDRTVLCISEKDWCMFGQLQLGILWDKILRPNGFLLSLRSQQCSDRPAKFMNSMLCCFSMHVGRIC